MNNQEIWYWMSQQSMTMGWWYNALVIPIACVLGILPFCSLFAIRQIRKLFWRWLILFLAWIPFSLIGPSLYLRIAPIRSLQQLGIVWSGQRALHPQTTQEIAAYSDQLALWGLIGASLMIPQVIIWMFISIPGLQPVVPHISRTITRIATRTFGKRIVHQTAMNSALGTLTIQTGHRQGLIESIRSGMSIGSDADIVLPDAVISREHARIENKHGTIWIRDLGSRNGTYLQRAGHIICITHDQQQLHSGDYLIFGDPDHHSAVKALFQQGAAS